MLASEDVITPNRERVLTDAKQTAMALAEEGYSAPIARTQIPVPGEAVLATLKLGVHIMRQGEYISDHDVKIANHVANILCGGSLTPGSLGERTIPAGFGASGIPVALRRTEDAGANCLHAEDRKAVEELNRCGAQVLEAT